MKSPGVVSNPMIHARTALISWALLLSCGGAPAGRDAQEERRQEEETARAVLRVHREKRAMARTEAEVIAAVAVLGAADPHPMIRSELVVLLERNYPPAVRMEVAEALGSYGKDAAACAALIRRAGEERRKDATVLRRTCLRVFASIATHGRSVDLAGFFSDANLAVAREAVAAAGTIQSVRMLKPLTDLLGELESIRDEGGEWGRRAELLEPTRAAINAIWRKIDSKKKLKSYTEANRAVVGCGAEIRRILSEENREDLKGRKP